MSVCDNIIKLPIELKNAIFLFLPIEIRIELIEDNKYSNDFGYNMMVRAYKHKRKLKSLYLDQKRLVYNTRICPIFREIKPIVYNDGREERVWQHPISNLIRSDFSYTGNDLNYRVCMYGFERNWSNENGGSLIITEDDWNLVPHHAFVKKKYVNYKSYSKMVKQKIISNCSTPIELILKYLKVKSFNKDWDYNMQKYFLNEYISFASSKIIKKYILKYKKHLRKIENDRLVVLEYYNRKRELKIMEKEEKYMKKILRDEKKIKKQQEMIIKKERIKEKKEINNMEKEEKYMKKYLKQKLKKK
jgi:hypothetical protein